METTNQLTSLSICIPAKNEELTIKDTIDLYIRQLGDINLHQVVVVDDHSTDNTKQVVTTLAYPGCEILVDPNPHTSGVGNAIKHGLSLCQGDAIAICMADGSDSPDDIKNLLHALKVEDAHFAFGSRFTPSSTVTNYPKAKLILNRLFNRVVQAITGTNHNDSTNLFQLFTREGLRAIQPIKARNFNIGLEIYLKAIKSGLRITHAPINWQQRQAGQSKMRILKNAPSYIATLLAETLR